MANVVSELSPTSVRPVRRDRSAAVLRWTCIALVTTVWVSATLFGVYILAFYAGALADRDMQAWNEVLPGLYEPTTPAATAGIALHFAAGGVILVLGCIQLIGAAARATRRCTTGSGACTSWRRCSPGSAG